MAILIPSKNIYDKQNPKIRDNVIERIEIGAVKVSPDNEYETPIYNQDLDFSNIETTENIVTMYQDVTATNQGGSTIRNVRGACGLKYVLKYVKTPEIYIPKVQKNKFISKIYDGKDENGNQRIRITLRINQINYNGNSTYQPSSNTFDFQNATLTKEETEKENIFYGFENFKYEKDISSNVSLLSVSSVKDLIANHSVIEENNQLKISSYLYANSNYNWTPKSEISIDNYIKANLQNEDIFVTSEIINDIEYYKLSSIKILIGIDTIFTSCLIENENIFSNVSNYYRAVASRVLQECQQLAITVSGNTIGIDLQNKTVYINGEKSKKVFSVDGNELMQTSNYYQSTDTNAIERAFTDTQSDYANGKETATIRCSISDYYDYNSKEPLIFSNGTTKLLPSFATAEKVVIGFSYYIGIELVKEFDYEIVATIKYKWYDDNSELNLSSLKISIPKGQTYATSFISDNYPPREIEIVSIVGYPTKMSFHLYDQVIPMVYGADGKDRPMSTYKDGTPKVFSVLGTNIYYDGAVWQELSLQEVDKSEIL